MRSVPLSIAGCFVYLPLAAKGGNQCSEQGFKGDKGGFHGTERTEGEATSLPRNAGHWARLWRSWGGAPEIWAGLEVENNDAEGEAVR